MLQKLRYKLAVFMQGRYGTDNLYRALMLLYALLLILQIFLDSKILSILLLLDFFWMFFRVFSKNHTARAKENRAYLKLISPFKSFFSLSFKRLRDIKTKRYRKCPHCKAITRLPIRKGTHSVRCPKCSQTFKVKILF